MSDKSLPFTQKKPCFANTTQNLHLQRCGAKSPSCTDLWAVLPVFLELYLRRTAAPRPRQRRRNYETHFHVRSRWRNKDQFEPKRCRSWLPLRWSRHELVTWTQLASSDCTMSDPSASPDSAGQPQSVDDHEAASPLQKQLRPPTKQFRLRSSSACIGYNRVCA